MVEKMVLKTAERKVEKMAEMKVAMKVVKMA